MGYITPSDRIVASFLWSDCVNCCQQEAFEKCWAHSPLRAAARRIAIHQVPHAATVAHAACALMSTATTTTTTRDRGVRYGPIEWAQQGSRTLFQQNDLILCSILLDGCVWLGDRLSVVTWQQFHLASRVLRVLRHWMPTVTLATRELAWTMISLRKL